ncbi:hypothetical protein [Streptosporangium sp. NPDC002721]|uniref:hypothetical protein n=1 Tax=Streptosporangium sp. NPDC002721 TaxID=3366188 RepID=UPI0036BC895E
MKDIFEEWLQAYVRVYDDPQSLEILPCPSCGHSALRLVYNVYDSDRSVGWVEFWCDNCRKGIFLSRAVVPEWGVTVTSQERQAMSGDQDSRFEIIPPPIDED